jgi:hypothetical protein
MTEVITKDEVTGEYEMGVLALEKQRDEYLQQMNAIFDENAADLARQAAGNRNLQRQYKVFKQKLEIGRRMYLQKVRHIFNLSIKGFDPKTKTLAAAQADAQAMLDELMAQ